MHRICTELDTLSGRKRIGGSGERLGDFCPVRRLNGAGRVRPPCDRARRRIRKFPGETCRFRLNCGAEIGDEVGVENPIGIVLMDERKINAAGNENIAGDDRVIMAWNDNREVALTPSGEKFAEIILSF